MPTTFLNLPTEVRDMIYELCLVHHKPINPWNRRKRCKKLGSGLFRVNTTLGREAQSFFYSRNCFDLTWEVDCRSAKWGPGGQRCEDRPSLLNDISPSNASCIEHILISFPDFSHSVSGDVTLAESNTVGIASIESRCASIKTIRMPARLDLSTRVLEASYPGIIFKVLPLVDSLLRTSPSLQDIIIEEYPYHTSEITLSSDCIQEETRKLGWKLVIEKRIPQDPGLDTFAALTPDRAVMMSAMDRSNNLQK